MRQAKLVERALANVARPQEWSFKSECKLVNEIKSHLPNGYRVLLSSLACSDSFVVTVWAPSGRIVKPDADYPYANWII